MRLTSLLLGVPKFRTCKPKLMTRKFGFTKLYYSNEQLVACKKCGSPHVVQTVCGECYRVVKEETDRIKQETMGLHKVN